MNVILALILGMGIGTCIGVWGPALLAELRNFGKVIEPDYAVKARVKLNDVLDERPNTVPRPQRTVSSARHRLAADRRV